MKTNKEKRPILYNKDERPSLEGIPRLEASKLGMYIRTTFVGSKDYWIAHYVSYCVGFRRNSIFWQEKTNISCTFKDGRLYGVLDPTFKDVICRIYNLDWITSNPWTLELLGNRSYLWTNVMKGKITNPEALAKAFSKRYFRGAYSYRSIKQYAIIGIQKFGRTISLWDIYEYSTNPEAALLKVTTMWALNDDYTLLCDVIHYCKLLGTQFNPLWSPRRLQEEHQKQIEMINMAEASNCSDEDIFPIYEKSGLSLITNERACFLEGCTMHNCIHACYWPRVKKGVYLIARGYLNEEYVDLGIFLQNDVPCMEQIRKIYNGSVLEATEQQAKDWIEDNKDELLSILNTIQSKCSTEIQKLPI